MLFFGLNSDREVEKMPNRHEIEGLNGTDFFSKDQVLNQLFKGLFCLFKAFTFLKIMLLAMVSIQEQFIIKRCA